MAAASQQSLGDADSSHQECLSRTTVLVSMLAQKLPTAVYGLIVSCPLHPPCGYYQIVAAMQ